MCVPVRWAGVSCLSHPSSHTDKQPQAYKLQAKRVKVTTHSVLDTLGTAAEDLPRLAVPELTSEELLAVTNHPISKAGPNRRVNNIHGIPQQAYWARQVDLRIPLKHGMVVRGTLRGTQGMTDWTIVGNAPQDRNNPMTLCYRTDSDNVVM